jgi:hypothetical protein
VQIALLDLMPGGVMIFPGTDGRLRLARRATER